MGLLGALKFGCKHKFWEASDTIHGDGLRGISTETRSIASISSGASPRCDRDLCRSKGDGEPGANSLLAIPSKCDLSEDTGRYNVE